MSKTAFLFPGQGSQKAGMGKDFYEKFESSRRVYDEADQILDFDIKEICFEENDKLSNTKYTQAALVTTCLAIAEAVKEVSEVKADAAAGLSLGEYTAIAFAGGMDYKDAILTVRNRGIYMDEAVPAGVGAMSAVMGMTAQEISAAVADMENVNVANYNCPGQMVITGKAEAVAMAGEELLTKGARRVVPLKVSGPFHSPYMVSAGEKLEKDLAQVNWKELSCPYYTNVTGKAVDNTASSKELLVAQVSSSVYWEQSIRNMIADGFDTFVEIGPGKTLTGFIKKTDDSVRTINISKVEDLEQLC